MRFSLPIRIVVYVVVFGLAFLALLAGGTVAWQKRTFWESQLEQLGLESIQVSAEFLARFRDVNFKLLHYELSRRPDHLEDFNQASKTLYEWLVRREGAIPVPEGREILRQVRLEYEDYVRHVDEFLANLPPAEAITPDNQWLSEVENDSLEMFALQRRLAGIQQEALQRLLERARGDVEWLERGLYVAWIAVFISLLMLAWVVYRDLIAPLRRTVIESRAIIERQEKLSALGLVAAGLAHEIRNPLNSIKARLFTQRRMLGEHSPGLEDNRFIDEEIDRLEGIVQGALAFARPAPPQFQAVSLHAVLEGLGQLVRPSLEKSGIVCRMDLGQDFQISADPNQLKQALLNLVNNAAESIGRNGTITVRIRPARLTRHRGLQGVAIEVEDTGAGISPEAQPRLFDPFFTTKEHGTGLGLSLTARMVDAHGGQLECRSAPGRGALFRILLPREQTHEENQHSPD